MVQALLADQFALKVHHETKEIWVYALVVGKGGPKLKEADALSLTTVQLDRLPKPGAN